MCRTQWVDWWWIFSPYTAFRHGLRGKETCCSWICARGCWFWLDRGTNCWALQCFSVNSATSQGENSYWADLKDASRSGRPRSIRTSENVAAVSLEIEENPRQSIRSLARKFHFPETSMRELIHEDLHMKSHAIQSKPRLTEATRLRRLERIS